MKLKFYHEILNVGDALNPLIFNTLLPNHFDLDQRYETYNFFGIGTLIDSRVDLNSSNIFFGTGLRDISFSDTISHSSSCDFRFVRGPLSAKLLGQKKFITDPAYLVKELPFYKNIKKNKSKKKIGVIPYFLQENHLKNLTSDDCDLFFISPVAQPEDFLQELSTCDYVFTAAMHGAILADLLRIPWCRFKVGNNGSEKNFLSDLKWNDWAMSMNIYDIPTIEIPYQISSSPKIVYPIKNYLIKKNLVRMFETKLKNDHFALSTDQILDERIEQLKLAIEAFKKDYPI